MADYEYHSYQEERQNLLGGVESEFKTIQSLSNTLKNSDDIDKNLLTFAKMQDAMDKCKYSYNEVRALDDKWETYLQKKQTEMRTLYSDDYADDERTNNPYADGSSFLKVNF